MKAAPGMATAEPLGPPHETAMRPRPTARDIVEAGVGFVTHTLRHLRVPDNLVHDATQDVFVVALHRLGEFEGRSSLRTWLFGICLRVAQRYRRGTARDRREALTDDPPDVPVEAEQEAHVGRSEYRRALDAILEELEESQRMVFVLYEIERLSMKEVAEALGCPLQTAYYRHQAARKRVLEAFERHHPKEDA